MEQTNFKIGDKIRFFKQSEHTSTFYEHSQGVVKQLGTNNLGEVAWLNILWIDYIKNGVLDVFEWTPIGSKKSYVKKF